jgi:hypothetical protein
LETNQRAKAAVQDMMDGLWPDETFHDKAKAAGRKHGVGERNVRWRYSLALRAPSYLLQDVDDGLKTIKQAKSELMAIETDDAAYDPGGLGVYLIVIEEDPTVGKIGRGRLTERFAAIQANHDRRLIVAGFWESSDRSAVTNAEIESRGKFQTTTGGSEWRRDIDPLKVHDVCRRWELRRLPLPPGFRASGELRPRRMV